MINKEEFKELIQDHNEQNKYIDKFCEIFPGSYDAYIFDWGFRMFDKLISVYFDEEGADWVCYYLYENPEKRYYINDIARPLDTLDDLWELIKDHRI